MPMQLRITFDGISKSASTMNQAQDASSQAACTGPWLKALTGCEYAGLSSEELREVLSQAISSTGEPLSLGAEPESIDRGLNSCYWHWNRSVSGLLTLWMFTGNSGGLTVQSV